jgi:hypothetical protein
MSSGFERGANVSMSVPYNLFAVSLVLVVIIAVAVVYVGASRGWMKGDIKVGELKGYVMRGLIFIVVVTILLGVV